MASAPASEQSVFQTGKSVRFRTHVLHQGGNADFTSLKDNHPIVAHLKFSVMSSPHTARNSSVRKAAGRENRQRT